MNKVIDTFLNGKLPSWVHKDERAYKKGGKVKKDKKPRKPKTPSISQKVNVNVKIGDSVLLRKGNVPRRGNPGVAKRFLSHGSAFGGGLPGPLNSSSYGSAPQVAMPLGRMDFISSSDAYFNRNRDKRDDIPIEVNPSGIHADVSPSVRAVQNTKAVETPDSVLSSSRSSAGVKAMREAFANMPTAIFQGEIPRLGGAELAPSARAMASQPSTGFMNTKGSMIGAMPGGASSGGSLDDYRFQAQSAYDRPPELPLAELPGMSKDESAQPAVSKLKPVRVSMDKQYPPGSAQEKAQSTKTLMALIKSDYPSLKLLKAEGFDSYEDAFETYKSNMDHGLPGLKRGGRVHSAF